MITVASCDYIQKDTYANNLKTMTARFHHELNDSLFKQNIRAKIYELKVIGYDTIDESYFMQQLVQELDKLEESANSSIDDCKDLVQPFPWEKPDAEEIAEIKKLRKEIRFYEKMRDYILNKKYKPSNNRYYLYKEFRKATYIDNNGKQNNYLDTLKIVFKSDLQMLKEDKDYPLEFRRLSYKILNYK